MEAHNHKLIKRIKFNEDKGKMIKEFLDNREGKKLLHFSFQLTSHTLGLEIFCDTSLGYLRESEEG